MRRYSCTKEASPACMGRINQDHNQQQSLHPLSPLSAAMEELEAMYVEKYLEKGKGHYFEKPGPEHRYKAVTITASRRAEDGAKSFETELETDSLAGFMASPSPVDDNAQPVPRLQLIGIEGTRDGKIRIDSQIFRDLLDAASISAEGLWLLAWDKRGIHSTCRSEVYETHYVGHTYWTMAWSFDQQRLCTKVLYMADDEDYESFTSMLK